MSKRFIDTSLFNKRWFREFPPKMKLFYLYMLTQCDHAGMYDVDLELASFQTGMPVRQEDIDEYLKDHIQVIKEDKFWIKAFPSFQYGILNQNVKAHASVMKILDKYNCLEQFGNSFFSKLRVKFHCLVKLYSRPVKEIFFQQTFPAFKDFINLLIRFF